MNSFAYMVVAAALVFGCTTSDEHPSAPEAGKRSYTKIQGAAQSTRRAIGLCELANGWPRGGGVYQVVSLDSALELADLSGEATATALSQPFTYIHLKSVKAWTAGAPQDPVARIIGGEWATGNVLQWPVSLAVGEQVGLVFYDPYPTPTSNHGFLTVHPQGLFQAQANGGYSNTELFTASKMSLDEIGEMLTKVYAALPGCPFDVAPDSGSMP